MCAINGITAENKSLVEEMNTLTKHRGPDGSSVYEGTGVTFGHNRLAIIDVSSASDQPMKSNDGRYVIVFNGEIYNYTELREEIGARYTFRTQGDTEVLLASYSVWGKDMFSKLQGIFAFAIWDVQTESLLLARDHMGVKPLYYNIENEVLAFSSEIPALLSGMKKKILDKKSLSFYLAMEYVPSPRTLVEGVMKLEAGQMLTFKKGTYSISSFLSELPVKRAVLDTEVYETIDVAVKRQLVSDRQIGAYLSGGFDSSVVVHHMAKYSPHVRTYSVDFEMVGGQEGDSSKFNIDAQLAEKTGAFFGTNHHTYTITLDTIRTTLETAIASANEPIANSTAVTQYLLSDYVRKDGTIVVLGGDGGDELFGGYPRHRIIMTASLFQKLPNSLEHLLGTFSSRINKLGTPFGTSFHRSLMVKDEKKIHPFLKEQLSLNNDSIEFFDALYAREGVIQNEHPLDTFMRADRKTWLPDECFLRSDYASMAHGIELRVPLVDTDVVRLSDEISVWKKTLPHEGKRIIRKAYKSHLPSHLYNQPKRGWLSPAAKWFRDPAINAFTKEVFSSGYYNGLDTIFDWESVQKMLDDHVEKRGYYLYPLWNILVLQIWARKNGIVTNI